MVDTRDKRLPTIVYVEDNTGDAVLLEEALRERRHAAELMVIDTGDKALRYFQVKNSARDLPPPHCILLDTHLPIVTGAQLLRFLRGSPVFDGTPIYIFGSAEEYEAVIEETSPSRASFIAKPEEWDRFLELADLLMASVDAPDAKGAGSTD